jgi:uncharacterized protein with FMN-binding domain
MIRKKTIIGLLISVIIVFILLGCWKVAVGNPDLKKVKDGTYIGEYAAGPVAVKAQITVQNHRITEVKILEHRTGRGKPAEAITANIVTAQSLQVDAISGATLSSKVILKAVELGLEQGMELQGVKTSSQDLE